MEATLRFNNPYRLDFNITNLKTDYFRTTQEGPYQENDTKKFANGTVSPVDSLIINRTRAVNASAKAGDPDFLVFDYGLTNIHTIFHQI